MIQKIPAAPYQAEGYHYITLVGAGPLDGFPFLAIDRDSYIVGLEVQSGINFDAESNRHCKILYGTDEPLFRK